MLFQLLCLWTRAHIDALLCGAAVEGTRDTAQTLHELDERPTSGPISSPIGPLLSTFSFLLYKYTVLILLMDIFMSTWIISSFGLL